MEGFGDGVTFGNIIKNVLPNASDPRNYKLIFTYNMNPSVSNDRYRKIFGGTRSVKNVKEGNLNLFKLENIYQSHLDIVGELIVKYDRLSNSYANSLGKIFNLLGSNKDEFYQFYFGNYFNDIDFQKRPMSKLTKDIVRQVLPNHGV